MLSKAEASKAWPVGTALDRASRREAAKNLYRKRRISRQTGAEQLLPQKPAIPPNVTTKRDGQDYPLGKVTVTARARPEEAPGGPEVTSSAPVETRTAKVRRELTPEQREAKNAADRARRAAKKTAG